jgi:methylated-DNA-[protein]-cysteine S-methyltransferase
MTIFIDYLQTPLGLFEFMATEHQIFQAIFCGNKPESDRQIRVNHLTNACKYQLTEYFAGHRQYFDLPLAPKGTRFQQSVWGCLTNIPFGAIKSYSEIALLLNNPKASQAVGGANARNPITLIIPCHRVISKNNLLTGYAGGIARKLWLLNHEGIGLPFNNICYQHDLQQEIKQRQMKTQFLL